MWSRSSAVRPWRLASLCLCLLAASTLSAQTSEAQSNPFDKPLLLSQALVSQISSLVTLSNSLGTQVSELTMISVEQQKTIDALRVDLVLWQTQSTLSEQLQVTLSDQLVSLQASLNASATHLQAAQSDAAALRAREYWLQTGLTVAVVVVSVETVAILGYAMNWW